MGRIHRHEVNAAELLIGSLSGDHQPAEFERQLILRDLSILEEVASVTAMRISFSLTTDREDVRRRYEPHREANSERLKAIEVLAGRGLAISSTLALPPTLKRWQGLDWTQQNDI